MAEDEDTPPQGAEKQLTPADMTDAQLAERYPNVPPQLRRSCWGPGVSGSPGGKKSGPNTLTALLRLLDADDGALREAVAKKWLEEAILKGNTQILTKIMDRDSGPVTQKTEVVDYSKLAKTIRVVKVPPRGQPGEQKTED
jgi:hypothetical protein